MLACAATTAWDSHVIGWALQRGTPAFARADNAATLIGVAARPFWAIRANWNGWINVTTPLPGHPHASLWLIAADYAGPALLLLLTCLAVIKLRA